MFRPASPGSLALRTLLMCAIAVVACGVGCQGCQDSSKPGDSTIEQARTTLRTCFADATETCARYPGTPCLCAASGSDPACEFRTAEETDFEIADERGGNECIAACVANATCEQLKSKRGCFAACAEENCGPYRPINSWEACANSDATVECLVESHCADPPPADWVGEEADTPRGTLETCVDNCGHYFEHAGCKTTRECDEGSACLEMAPELQVGECTPIDGEIVTMAEVDPAPFASGCTANSDCVLARVGYDCECAADGCGHVGVLADRAADYDAAVDAAKAMCTPDLLCAPGEGECFADGDRVACVDSACMVVDNDSWCIADDECVDEGAYLDPSATHCVASWVDERLLSLACGECQPETSTPGFHTMPVLDECPTGYFCENDNTCQPFVACQTTADCAGKSLPEHPTLVCRDGLCKACEVDADCDDGEVCVADSPAPPEPGESGVWGAKNGCWAADSDAACLDWTCPRPCQDRDGRWLCQ